jgi:L-amino acid N-acyltransferase YncA
VAKDSRGTPVIANSPPSAEQQQVILRAATEADIESIASIYAYHVLHGTATFEIEPPGDDEMLRRWQAIQAARLPYLLAESDGEVLAFAYAGPYHARAAYRHTVENSIYVRAGSEGRGIGTKLLGELIADCESLGLRQMIALVGDGANTASIRMHERSGFERAGVLRSVGYKNGRWLDVIVMQRSLGAGDAAPPDTL